MTLYENNTDNPSSPDLLKITLRGDKENDKTINLEITDEMTSEEALQKLKKELEAFKFGKDEFNLIEIPYHPKLIGSIEALKERLPEGIGLELLMDGDVSKIIAEIGEDNLKEALQDFEKADKITFRSEEDKKAYINALETVGIKIDEKKDKHKFESKGYLAKFGEPMNNRNKSDEESKKSQGSKKLRNVSKPKQGR